MQASSTYRRLLLPIYLPTFLYSMAQGVLVPVLPIYAKHFGGSYAIAGVVVAAAWIGTTICDVPAGLILPKLGFRLQMIVGAMLFGGAAIVLGLVHTIPVMISIQLVAGVGTAMWGVARHSYLTQATTVGDRGRAISLFGGINRGGQFVGPTIGGFVAQYFGLGTAIVVAGSIACSTIIVVALFVRETEGITIRSSHRLDLGVLRQSLAGNGQAVTAAGTVQVFGQMVRAGKQVVVPLFAKYAIGLDTGAIGQIISASSLVDMLMFPVAGFLMDRWGRKAAVVPSFTILSIAMLLIPFCGSYWALLGAMILAGLGNGIGAGTMMTLGADLAPVGRTGEFLGIWRLIGDSGSAIAPLVAGAVADAIGIGLTTGATAGLGIIAAFTMAFFMRETRWDHVPSDQRPPSRSPFAGGGWTRLLGSTRRKS